MNTYLFYLDFVNLTNKILELVIAYSLCSIFHVIVLLCLIFFIGFSFFFNFSLSLIFIIAICISSRILINFNFAYSSKLIATAFYLIIFLVSWMNRVIRRHEYLMNFYNFLKVKFNDIVDIFYREFLYSYYYSLEDTLIFPYYR